VKTPDEKSPAEVAAWLEKNPEFASAFREAAKPPIETWKDGSPRRASDLYDEERAMADQQYFNETWKSGLQARVRAEREEEARAARKAEQIAERDRLLAEREAYYATVEREREQREAARREYDRVVLVNTYRRSNGQTPLPLPPNPDGKPRS
jgi:hypothetical protein